MTLESRPIERQLLEFLATVVERSRADVIVCGERKGTAVLRALIQEIEPPRLNWRWDKIVSSSILEQYDWSKVAGGRVLIFDELVHHGRTLRTTEERVARVASPDTRIVTAGFAVWERCVTRPDYSYFAALDLERYEVVRGLIVEFLQEHGSLLLDTEHIELTVRVDCDVAEFYRHVARAAPPGHAHSFVSGSRRLNLTVQSPDIEHPDLLQRWLTKGSSVEHVANKARILERDHSTFSVMPIFYPNTRCVVDDEWLGGLPEFVCKDSLDRQNAKQIFYLVGLLASIESLRGVVTALGDLVRAGKIVIEVPPDTFSHLSAMFPRIDAEALWRYTRDVVADAKTKRPRRSARADAVHHIPEAALVNLSYRVITRLLAEMDRDAEMDGLLEGRSWQQLAEISEKAAAELKIDAATMTAVPDRLIDSGIMTTNVEEVEGSDGSTWAVRTFAPAGEIVSEKLRRQLGVRGTEWLPRT